MKTFSLRKEDIERRWWLVDAAGQPLGRLASRIAQILRGKHKPTFTPHVNGGDFVAVWGMLPKTTLSRQHVKQMLKVYAGPEHPHAAQQPTPLVAVEAK
ncbi:MAG: hypothetical protein AUG85_13770 [Gemmatimonadetes bacterium 13_1_20CM_4_66_11]|nr:MAG: hypothetical protein AUG85_13770 [Gemmatimonadetes bacterium 13_1_20CM_4_66_11]